MEKWLATDESVVVGRTSEKADWPIELDPMMSQGHFRITFDGEQASVVDLDSTNGTYVNSQRINTAHLRPGDCLVAGQTRFEIACVSALIPVALSPTADWPTQTAQSMQQNAVPPQLGSSGTGFPSAEFPAAGLPGVGNQASHFNETTPFANGRMSAELPGAGRSLNAGPLSNADVFPGAAPFDAETKSSPFEMNAGTRFFHKLDEVEQLLEERVVESSSPFDFSEETPLQPMSPNPKYAPERNPLSQSDSSVEQASAAAAEYSLDRLFKSSVPDGWDAELNDWPDVNIMGTVGAGHTSTSQNCSFGNAEIRDYASTVVSISVVDAPLAGSSGLVSRQLVWIAAGQTLVVGRSASQADWAISSDPFLSGKHFQLKCESGRCYLQNLSRTNGTFVEKTQVDRAVLRDGETIAAGQSLFQIKVQNGAEVSDDEFASELIRSS